MRVCLLNDSFPPVIDGVVNVVTNYASILTERYGDDVVVATAHYPEGKYDGYPYRVVDYPSLDTTTMASGYRTGYPVAFKENAELMDFAPEVIHLHCPFASAFMARILREQVAAPLVFTYHTKFDEDIARAVKAEVLRKTAIRAVVNNIEASDEVWVVSAGAGENLKSLGFNGTYRVMKNGVDFVKGKASPEAVREAVRGYDLPEGVPVFLYVGRMMRYKGIFLILDALRGLTEAGIDYRMIFVGKGPDADELARKAAEYGIGDKCIFTGPVYDREVLRAINTRADLFLFPSTFDTSGLVVREAAACGLPAVVIEGSCAAEDVADRHNGYLIRQDAASLCALLTELVKDLNAVHAVGDRAMEELYVSWNDSVSAARKRYGELITAMRAGELPRAPQKPLDVLLAAASDSIADWNRFFKLPGQMAADLREGLQGMLDNISGSKEPRRDIPARPEDFPEQRNDR